MARGTGRGDRGSRGSGTPSRRQANNANNSSRRNYSSHNPGLAKCANPEQNSAFGSSNPFQQQTNPDPFNMSNPFSQNQQPPAFGGTGGQSSFNFSFSTPSNPFSQSQQPSNPFNQSQQTSNQQGAPLFSAPTNAFTQNQQQTTAPTSFNTSFSTPSTNFGFGASSGASSNAFGQPSAFAKSTAPANAFSQPSAFLHATSAPANAFNQPTSTPNFGFGTPPRTQSPAGLARPRSPAKFGGFGTPSLGQSPASGSSPQYSKTAVTRKIDQFLAEVNQIIQAGDSESKEVRERNAVKLQQYLPIEPKFADDYNKIIYELTTFYKDQEDKLSKKCESLLTKAVEGTWTAFVNFIATWFSFIRTVDPSNLLETYNSLDALVQKANLALTHPTLGFLILPTVISYARVLCRLAIGLEKQPELIAQFIQPLSIDEGGGETITLPERAANTLRSAFSTCLTDKSFVKTPLGTDETGKPAGKKMGIYAIANICLKILFQCNKSRNAEQIFANIDLQSPPLAIYPKAQQVTYLYYLGRFHFSMNHFYRALKCLEHAYALLPADPAFAPAQKRLILVYLVAASIICARFPSPQLLSRPEAHGFQHIFGPIVRALKTGDLALFRQATSLEPKKNPYADWMLHYRILLQLQNRCEILVYRSLARAVFRECGSAGSSERRAAPSLEISYLVHAAQLGEKKALGMRDGGGIPGVRHTNWSFMEMKVPKNAGYVDPDFEGVEALEFEDDEGYEEGNGEGEGYEENEGYEGQEGNYDENEEGYDEEYEGDETQDDGEGDGREGEHEGEEIEYTDDEDNLLLPDELELESIATSLIDQGFLNGWISRGKSVRIAIKGATQSNALQAGFPNPWDVIRDRMEAEGGAEVPGWKRVDSGAGGSSVIGAGGFGGGNVVRLTGARPVGTNPFG